jgi:plasmid stabilization system protein ParE
MPKAWSARDERKYEHIKKSQKEDGKSAERAKEIAARTVNRDRREEGRTPNRSTSGTGNPNRKLEDRTVEELRNRASELDIRGRSSMTKGKLVEAIRAAE